MKNSAKGGKKSASPKPGSTSSSLNGLKNSSAVAVNLEERWLDKQDILQRLHISSGTLYKWRKTGLLPYTAIQKKFFYKESDIQKLLHYFNSANGA